MFLFHHKDIFAKPSYLSCANSVAHDGEDEAVTRVGVGDLARYKMVTLEYTLVKST